MQVQTRGEFGGLGIEVTMEDGLVKVVAPLDDAPAAKAGILAGDVITHLDDAPVQGLTLDEAVSKMRGAIGSSIKLTIKRAGQEQPIDVAITRDTIRVRAVRMRIEGGDVGYIRITQFNQQTTEGLKKALGEVAAQIANTKLKGYIIDLRNNPGGLLDQAVSVADEFLGGAKTSRGADATPPIVDGGSASGRVVAKRATVHIPDILADPEYTRSERRRGVAETRRTAHHAGRAADA